jgi:hypothetical protein
MAKKKELKPAKPTAKDKEIKAKPTGYRYKTKDVDALRKQDGSLNKKGKDLYFKRPKKEDVEKFKKNADGSFPDETKQIYHEKRQDRKHSDDNLKKKYEEGGETPAVVVVEMSVEDMRTALGREPKYPYDFISGKKYVKCFLRPFYKCEE